MREETAQRAYHYFQCGMNCAESSFRALIECFDPAADEQIFRTATPFGGGVGSSRKELCGALSGSVMAVGWILGRIRPDESDNPSKEIALRLCDQFRKFLQETRCQVLYDRFGKNQNLKCAYLTSSAVGWTYDLLVGHGMKPVKRNG